MKIIYKKSFILLFINFIFLLFSCTNFGNASDLKKEIEDKIDYTNAPSVTVRVITEDGAGNVYPANESKFKIGYNEEISFEENASHIFYKWATYSVETVNNSEHENITSGVVFDDPYSKKTNVTVLDKSLSLVKIRALCYPKTYIASSYPQYPKDNIVPNNTSITVSFKTYENFPLEKNSFFYTDKEIEELLEKESDITFINDNLGNVYGYESYNTIYFKNIKIEKDGFSALDYFGAPVITGSLLIIPVAKSIPLGDSDYKDIKVTLGNEIYCETDDGSKLPLIESDSNSWTYRISKNSEDEESNNAVIQFSENQNIDELTPIQGIYTYNINQIIDLNVKVKSEYIFKSWKVATSTGSYEYNSNNEDKSLYIPNDKGQVCLVIEDATSESTKLTVKKGCSGIIITPVCEKIPVANIYSISQQGKVSPEGNYNCQQGKSFDLRFVPDSEYAFSYWQIKINGITVNSADLAEFIDMDTSKADNNVLIKKVPDVGIIQFIPVCNIRPKALSYTPTYSLEGSYRDSRIKVLFDSKMSLKAFFWTKDELELDGINEEGGYKLFEYTDAKDSEGNTLYYAYCLNTDQTEDLTTLQFKNIKIINRQTGVNLLQYFEAPYFETNKCDVLIIPSKVGETESVPAYTDVYVTIDKSAVNSSNVSLVSSLSWCYFVSSDYDEDEPDLTITEINTFHSKYVNISNTLGSNNLNLVTTTHTEPTRTNLKDYVRTSGSFTIKGKVVDTGSLPSSVELQIKQKETNWYEYTGSSKKITQQLVPIAGEAAFNFTNLDISELFAEDGVYELSVTAYDNNNNSKTNVFEYIVFDDTCPKAPEEVESYAFNGGYSILWKYYQKDLDLDNVSIVPQSGFDPVLENCVVTDNDITPVINNNEFIVSIVTNANNGNSYNSEIIVTDLVGNSTTIEQEEYAGIQYQNRPLMYVYKTKSGKNDQRYSCHLYKNRKDSLVGITDQAGSDCKSGRVLGLIQSEPMTRDDAFEWCKTQFCGDGELPPRQKIQTDDRIDKILRENFEQTIHNIKLWTCSWDNLGGDPSSTKPCWLYVIYNNYDQSSGYPKTDNVKLPARAALYFDDMPKVISGE